MLRSRMMVLSMFFSVGLISVGFAAEKKGKTPGSNCGDESLCTQEYAPTICRYKDKEFKGSNPCTSKKEVRRYACEKKLKLVETEIACQPQPESKAE